MLHILFPVRENLFPSKSKPLSTWCIRKFRSILINVFVINSLLNCSFPAQNRFRARKSPLRSNFSHGLRRRHDSEAGWNGSNEKEARKGEQFLLWKDYWSVRTLEQVAAYVNYKNLIAICRYLTDLLYYLWSDRFRSNVISKMPQNGNTALWPR